jgi:hypothetical protein
VIGKRQKDRVISEAGFSSATGQNDNQSAVFLRISQIKMYRFNAEGVKKTKSREARLGSGVSGRGRGKDDAPARD